MKKIFIPIVILLLISNVCFAIRDPLRPAGSPIQGLDHVVNKILSWLWPFSMVIAVLMIIIGAYFLVLGGSDPNKVTMGKKTIVYALVGFAIVTISRGIIELVRLISGTHVLALIPTIINWAFGFLLAIAVLMIIAAAYMFVTGGGNPEQLGKARNLLMYALIGLALALVARGLIYILASVLG